MADTTKATTSTTTSKTSSTAPKKTTTVKKTTAPVVVKEQSEWVTLADKYGEGAEALNIRKGALVFIKGQVTFVPNGEVQNIDGEWHVQ
jgi:hypothetical protein